jgi:hypothetical protein
VYDTSKDSDGGAWRKRTQGTSWYNETLNTATRGSRKEFPAVAVIVAEATKVTIYDGDDPDLPMWMVLNFVGYGMVSGSMNGVTAVNGLFSLSGGANAISFVDFLKDSGTYLTSTLWNNVLGSIADRHVAKSGFGSQYSTQRLVNSTVNDVAMTVLPNAPIDAATGLPVPTIALATNGGVSVIKDDGTVVDITWSAEGVVGRIAFIGDKIRIGGGSLNYVQYAERMYDIPTSDTALGAMYVDDATAVNVYLASSMYNTNIFTADMFYNGTTSNKSYAVKNAIGSSTKGLTHLSENYEDATKGMMAYATSDYNTGWMNGDIKLATLSDTDATNVTGSELVTNGTFDTDTSGWTAVSGTTLSVASGELSLTSSSATTAQAFSSFTTVVGETYTLSFSSRNGTAVNLDAIVGVVAGDASLVNTSNYAGATSQVTTATFVAASTTTYISLRMFVTASGQVGYFDNVSVRLAEEDRSVNGNGLQVFGTVTKSAVDEV